MQRETFIWLIDILIIEKAVCAVRVQRLSDEVPVFPLFQLPFACSSPLPLSLFAMLKMNAESLKFHRHWEPKEEEMKLTGGAKKKTNKGLTKDKHTKNDDYV